VTSSPTTRLICRSRRKWWKQLLAIRVMCCFIDSSVSSSTPRSRTTSTGLRMPESSCSVRSLPETFSKICLEPNQISSVLSVFKCNLRDGLLDCLMITGLDRTYHAHHFIMACHILYGLLDCLMITGLESSSPSRRLHLNTDKTELIWFGSRQILEKVSGSDLTLYSLTVTMRQRGSAA